MNARFAPLTAASLVLRVLNGRQAGAEYRLRPGISISIGHSFNHDVVLRNRDSKDLSLQLVVGDSLAEVKVLAGAITLLGRPIVAGQSAKLPSFVPVDAAGLHFAIGDPESDRWNEALQLSESPALDPDILPGDEDGPQEAAPGDVAAPPRQALNQRISDALPVKPIGNAVEHFSARYRVLHDKWDVDHRWPMIALVAAAVLLVIVIAGPAYQAVDRQTNGPTAIAADLNAEGFRGIKVTRVEGGTIRLTGLLRTDADLNKLREYAEKNLNRPDIAVHTMESMAASATALLTAQGVDADARPGRGNALIVESEYLPGDRLAELKQMIKTDMPGVGNIGFRFASARGDSRLQYFFSPGGYGLATYVEGDPSFIRTADGTSWMQGAKLPTGHTLLFIGDGAIRFERGGLVEQLVVIEPGQSGGAETDMQAEEKASQASEGQKVAGT